MIVQASPAAAPNDAALRWWKLPHASFMRFCDSLRWPVVSIEFSDSKGARLGIQQLADWEEWTVPNEVAIKPFRSVRGASSGPASDGNGRGPLRVGDGNTFGETGTGACFNCTLLDRQDQWNPRGPISTSASSLLLRPTGTIWVDHQFVRTPVMIFPFHFEVPASEAERVGKATVTVTIRPK
jgi:hypothetical protein